MKQIFTRVNASFWFLIPHGRDTESSWTKTQVLDSAFNLSLVLILPKVDAVSSPAATLNDMSCFIKCFPQNPHGFQPTWVF